jgi:hypothetical protein
MTLLEIVNRVLRRLREDEVADLTTDPYSTLLAEFVADAHREVVEAHDWAVFDHDLVVVVTAGQTDYDLASGSADLYSGTGTSHRSLVRYHRDMPMAYYFDTLAEYQSGTNGSLLAQLHPEEQAYQIVNRNDYTNEPSGFALVPQATVDALTLKLDTEPTVGGYIYVRFHTPEALIDVDTDVAREIYAPSAPVLARAIYYALNERGEEMGEPGNVAEVRSDNALAAAIETDRIRSSRTNTYEMYRD